MSEEPTEPTAAAGTAGIDDGEDHHPKGTMAILLVFLAATALMWSLSYFLLIERG